MAVTLAVTFPLGRYHATPWDRNVNEGACEWPPSAWRILRALVATWRSRWPELPAADFDELIERLGSPPTYRTPKTSAAHSRHYMPDADHKKGVTGATDLALDPFLCVSPDEPLLIRWDVELTPTQRTILAKLAELMPYLGRAESVCQARLLDEPEDEVPDERWWTPTEHPAMSGMRLLASDEPVRREALEVSTVGVRQARRSRPADSRWVNYRAPATATPTVVMSSGVDTNINAVRYDLLAQAPMRATHGVLLADALHSAMGHRIKRRIDEAAARAIFGKNGKEVALTDHQHAHWVPLADAAGNIRSIVVWVPSGLPSNAIEEMIRPVTLSGRLGDYEIKGFPPVTLVLTAMGCIENVAPELVGDQQVWRSATPYLPVRHRKRDDTPDGFLHADIRQELRYRGISIDVKVTRLEEGDGILDSWGRGFRRYRLKETLRESRPGLGLRLEFTERVCPLGDSFGPLLLGQLSHFGFGVFVPER